MNIYIIGLKCNYMFLVIPKSITLLCQNCITKFIIYFFKIRTINT